MSAVSLSVCLTSRYSTNTKMAKRRITYFLRDPTFSHFGIGTIFILKVAVAKLPNESSFW